MTKLTEEELKEKRARERPGKVCKTCGRHKSDHQGGRCRLRLVDDIIDKDGIQTHSVPDTPYGRTHKNNRRWKHADNFEAA